MKNTYQINPGDIFTIPLYLPVSQMGDYIDYRKYQFPSGDMYAFGRLIEPQMGNLELVEVFSYVGEIPKSPEIILSSGRMFEPVIVGSVFNTGRWRGLFENPQYDKWTDSNYKEIAFLLMSHTQYWKGGENIKVTTSKWKELECSGIPTMSIYGGMIVEMKIRKVLSLRGLELHYERLVEQRKYDYPKPRDIDRKLKETIQPFKWSSEHGRYTLFLDAGILHADSFAKSNLFGNGYDWEKIATAFIESHMPEIRKKVSFDCEADIFSMRSSSKKLLKEFALAFHEFVLDKTTFENLLSQI